ncbi:MAG: fatty acyl-CoA reductase [Acidimicrobiales bacterium]|jgi:fatty acyl-CoA reductase
MVNNALEPVISTLATAANLAGKRIAITGSTGFLGTALVERLIRSVPDCELVLLVRPGKRSTPGQRARREIFRNDAFNRLLADLGKEAFWDLVDRRVQVIAGDVGTDGLGLDDEGRTLMAGCDIVIHSAATVSFDAPLDGAVEVNLLGPTRIVETMHALGVTPHLVAVSTCYVAGNRRGSAPEQLLIDSPFHIDVDWRAEVTAARRTRADFDAESRSVDRLEEFRRRARYELGAAGTPLLAAKTEQIRQRWVSEQLVEAGRARAASLGWPDSYAYTKALGERALHESKGDVPVSIVRPSIIESAWAEPNPGWIKGFRMAEPIIISYARGLLKEFPGVPEGVVDVIPVDLVVAAIVNVAARGPLPADHSGGAPTDITQVASGTRNPLYYRQLVDLVSSWFAEHPLYDQKGQPIAVPEWSFPGRGAVERQLDRAQKNLARADRTMKLLPLRGKQAMLNAGVEEKRELVERASGYVKIYGAYAECEALFGVDALVGLHDSLDPASAAEFPCDPAAVDWPHYVQQVHLPTVVDHARVKTTGERSDPDARIKRLRSRVLAPERQLAAFDLENTIIASNVVFSYAWLATRNMGPRDRLKFTLKTMAEAPALLALDNRDRTDFLRHFYRRYDGASVEDMDRLGRELLADHILTKAFPAALRRVREHRRLGHRTVLITGALDIVVNPLGPLFDDVICAEMSVRDGRYTGELLAVPPTGEVRAQALRDYAETHGFDLAESVAYADSSSDLPLLEAAGFPVAINPETRLASIAIKRGWLIEYWSKAAGRTDKALPLGSLPTPRKSRR